MTTRIAIIGCGAVAHAHIPVIESNKGSRVTVLVDRVLERAQDLAKSSGVEHAVADYRDVVGLADAAIVALPHHLHAQVSEDLLRAGVHLLVEKPMALTTEECDRMIAAAKENSVVLAVGMARRFISSARYAKELLDSGLIGTVERFDFAEGSPYSWPVASDFMFRRDAGGGVLHDTGSHTLDLLLWWLGDPASVEYADDERGGAEADCEVRLVMKSGARGVCRLSRLRDLRNSCILEGTRGTLEVPALFNGTFSLTLAGQDSTLSGHFEKNGMAEDPLECFHRQLDDFLGAITDKREPLLSGTEARRVVDLIETCRSVRKPLVEPWDAIDAG